MKVTITTNHWRLPSAPTYLEGVPSPERRQREKAAARGAREVWKPGPEAFALLDRLRAAIGHDVVVQAWDPIMFVLDDEGPYPMRARCVDIVVRDDHDGHPQAYLVLEAIEVVTMPSGYDGRGALIADGNRFLFGVHDLYEIDVK